jgi:hypothetical protein
MGYTFELVRLPPGVDRDEAYKRLSEEREELLENEINADRIGPISPAGEQAKRKLAAALMARHPSLEMYEHNYSQIAKTWSIPESEARRRFRNMELNDKKLAIQILIFDDAAGASFSFLGDPQHCTSAVRVLWDCLRVLESEGGFSTYDPQIGRLLDLDSDFDDVRKCACGKD